MQKEIIHKILDGLELNSTQLMNKGNLYQIITRIVCTNMNSSSVGYILQGPVCCLDEMLE